MIINVAVTQALGFRSVFRTNKRSGAVTDNLSFVQQIDGKVAGRQLVSDKLSFFDKISYFVKKHNAPIHEVDVHQTLTFTQVIKKVWPETVKNKLSFKEAIKVNVIYNLSVTDTLQFDSEANTYILRKDKCDSYGIVIPTFGTGRFIVMTFGLASLTLRNPEWGDSYDYDEVRIMRNTRGGDLHVIRDPEWPKTETLTYNFKFLKQTDIDRIRKFRVDTLGKKVLLTDWKGQQWLGIISNPDEPFIEEHRNNFSTTIKMEIT